MQQMILASLALALAPSALAQESAPLFELTCPEPGRILTALEGLPSFERLSAAGLLGPRDRPDAALGELEENLGAPLATVLAALADRGLEVEFDLVRFKPSFVLRAEASDPIEARARLQRVLVAALDAADVDASPAELRQHRDGVEWWSLGDRLTVGFHDGRTVVANRRRSAEEALEGASGVAPDSADLSASLDLERLRGLTALGGDRGLSELAELGSEPEAAFGLGDSLASFGAADRVAFELTLRPNGAELSVHADGARVLAPDPVDAAPTLPPHPDDLVRLRIRRDLADFVARTEALADERSASLARQLGQIEVLFGGLEVRREVLPAIGNDWQVVVREIDFADSPRPDLALPAAAVAVPLDDPSLRQPLVATFQNLVAIRNVDVAQKGEGEPLLLRLAQTRDDGALSAAHRIPPKAGEPIDTDYNLAPACAAVGKWFVLASHEELLLELMDELPGDDAPAAAKAGEQLTLDARLAGQLLEQHADSIALLVALRRGMDEARVADAIAQLAGALGQLERFAMSVDPTESGACLRIGVGATSADARD